ncbi:hypothetical protein [Paracoccus yeei]|nr:hypothetical protein [Paracoccus yeei]
MTKRLIDLGQATRKKKRDPIPHHQSGTRGANLIKALPPKAAD